MKLKLIDRILMGNILPREGNIKTIIIIKDIKKKTELTQEELLKYEIEEIEGGGLKWKKEAAVIDFDVEFTELETNEIKACLKKLDKENKLTIDMMGLVELFDVAAE